jgi:hypothetical protein
MGKKSIKTPNYLPLHNKLDEMGGHPIRQPSLAKREKAVTP